MRESTELALIEAPISTSTIAPPHYVGAKVVIHYTQQSGYTDAGVVAFLNSHWIELVKEKGERLLIPTTAVRIIRMQEPAHDQKEALTLLRPSAHPDSNDV